MEEQFTLFTNKNSFFNQQFEKSDDSNQSPSTPVYHESLFATQKLKQNPSVSLIKSEVSTQKSTPLSMSPLSRQGSNNSEDKQSLFSSNDSQDFEKTSGSLSCSRQLKFLLEAEEELASIWGNQKQIKVARPIIIQQQSILKPTTSGFNRSTPVANQSFENLTSNIEIPERVNLCKERSWSDEKLIPSRPSNPMFSDNFYNGNYQFTQGANFSSIESNHSNISTQLTQDFDSLTLTNSQINNDNYNSHDGESQDEEHCGFDELCLQQQPSQQVGSNFEDSAECRLNGGSFSSQGASHQIFYSNMNYLQANEWANEQNLYEPYCSTFTQNFDSCWGNTNPNYFGLVPASVPSLNQYTNQQYFVQNQDNCEYAFYQ
eukprot:403361533